MKKDNRTIKTLCLMALLAGSLNSFGVAHNLQYYKIMNTRDERNLKGNVKKVVTYRVDFTREWGEIKIGDKHPIDSIIYDNQGRAILKWEPSDSYELQNRGITQNIFWSDGEQIVKFSGVGSDRGGYYSPNEYTDKTYSYKYDGNNRLISVTISSPGQKESKVFFKYNPQGGYSSTVYESIDSYGDTRNYDSVDDWDNYYDNYINHYDHEFKGYDSGWTVKRDSQGNWIEAEEYYDHRSDEKRLNKIIIREIEYYNPGEESVTVEDNSIYTSVDKMPEYPGGDKAFISELKELKNTAANNALDGTVTVKFIVKKNGKVGEIIVLNARHPYFERATEEDLANLKNKFIPAKVNGKAVNSWQTIGVIVEGYKPTKIIKI